MDAQGNLYVAGAKTRNVFKIEPSGKKTQIVDGKGAGEGKPLLFPNALAVDAQGNVFVAGNNSGNVLRIAPSGEIREIMGDNGVEKDVELGGPTGLAVDAKGNVYVARAGPLLPVSDHARGRDHAASSTRRATTAGIGSTRCAPSRSTQRATST